MNAKAFNVALLSGVLGLSLAAAALADGTHEWTGIQSKTAPPSPAACP